MIILVSDTSVLIDLERGGLLEASFSCGLTMIVPDLLYERELEAENGPLLRKLGLGVVALTPDEVAFAQRVRTERRKLSLPDCFALSCATRPNHVLVTGDGELRAEAISRLGKVYGLLWLLDQMASSGVLSSSQLHEGLSRIAAHPRCRLPQGEVRIRLSAWAPA
ncbi:MULTISPECIES: PIN domain-containing protein [Cupriavidus]|uniref:PIN domain-containing protein n=1 Tax=Cupriavidus cauae TaxID=2608999 RepID=A0A5M8AQJ9_9BURK|nr:MULTISPECIES: hypothetical protein [Cupriavidus]KAA6126227.1 hypothetical protein F1599_09665 [Cupriavidus cauae]MCA7083523.1 hypothetical protein [Cupriavidus sp. DB3]